MQLQGHGTTGLVVRWSGGRPNPVDLDPAEDVTFVEVPAEQFDRWERNDRPAIGTPFGERYWSWAGGGLYWRGGGPAEAILLGIR